MSVFKNLGEDLATKLYNDFLDKGMSEEDAFNEVYSIECNMDDDCEAKESEDTE